MSVKFTSHLDEVIDKVNKATRKALDLMGEKAVEFAQNAATVDTGNMRASITHEEESNEVEIVGTNNDKAPYKPVGYSVYVELGTRRMRAQPFIGPALTNHSDEYKSIAEDVFSSM